MNRSLRGATIGVLLLFPAVLSGCSAGQVAQTTTQERDKVGAMAQVGDIALRAVQLASPRGGGYQAGDDAQLTAAIVNGGQEADTLLAVGGEGFAAAQLQSGGTLSTGPTSANGTATGGTGTGRTGTGGTGTGGTATGSSSSGSGRIEIPADTTVLVDGVDTSITLTDLAGPLNVGQYIQLTFTFEKAGEVTVPVTVANPANVVERGPAFGFQQEGAGGAEAGSGNIARERESAGESAGDSGAGQSAGGEPGRPPRSPGTVGSGG